MSKQMGPTRVEALSWEGNYVVKFPYGMNSLRMNPKKRSRISIMGQVWCERRDLNPGSELGKLK